MCLILKLLLQVHLKGRQFNRQNLLSWNLKGSVSMFLILLRLKGSPKHRFQGKPVRFSWVKLETLQEKKTNLLIHLKEVACKDHVQHGDSVKVFRKPRRKYMAQ